MSHQDYKLGQPGYKLAGHWYQTKSLWLSGSNCNPASGSQAIWALDAYFNCNSVKEGEDGLIILCSNLWALLDFQTPLNGLYCSERWLVRLPTEQRLFRRWKESTIYEVHQPAFTDILETHGHGGSSKIRPQDEAHLTDLIWYQLCALWDVWNIVKIAKRNHPFVDDGFQWLEPVSSVLWSSSI
jgi:hypothetical protein